MKGLNIIALDKDFQIVSILSYTNLQWNRKYYEPGSFSMELPLGQYDSSMKYIYTKDRPEMGLITQVNYVIKGNYRAFNISGYFIEDLLNRRICYRKQDITNITNAPTWSRYDGKAETVALAYFNAFKDVEMNYNGQHYASRLPIESPVTQDRGHYSDHLREDEKLGNKMYKILKPSEMSYSVEYDFVASRMRLKIWKGVDRTQDNTENNNQIVFSTRFGNLKNPNILIDETNYRNAYIVNNSGSENDQKVEYVLGGINRLPGETEYDDGYVWKSTSDNKDDFSSYDAFIEALHNEGNEELNNVAKSINIEFDALEGSYEYMEDFDLGDKCSIEIPEINLSADAVLIGCYEVIKKGVNTLSLEFGTPVIK